METPAAIPLHVNIRRVVALTAVCGFVEAIGFKDLGGGIYPAIMTGNTVQLGLSVAQGAWSHFLLLAFVIGAFFIGCMIASVIRYHLKHPPLELGIMAVLLVIISVIREYPALRIPVELPMLAFALALQGETISRFGAVSLQTLVVTNNMIKFSDAFARRYLLGKTEKAKCSDISEMLLPGIAWLTYGLAAAIGAVIDNLISVPLLIPALLLVAVTFDLILNNAKGS